MSTQQRALEQFITERQADAKRWRDLADRQWRYAAQALNDSLRRPAHTDTAPPTPEYGVHSRAALACEAAARAIDDATAYLRTAGTT